MALWLQLCTVFALVVSPLGAQDQVTLELRGSSFFFLEGSNFTFTCIQNGTTIVNILLFLLNDDTRIPACMVSPLSSCSFPSGARCGCMSGTGTVRVYTFLKTNVQAPDAGNWSCLLPAVPGVSRAVSSLPLSLPLYVTPSVTAVGPSSLTVRDGDDVTVTCEDSRGVPPPSFSWTQPPRSDVPQSTPSPSRATLTFRADRGQGDIVTLTCTASNLAGTSYVTFSVSVQYPPHVTATSVPPLLPDGSVVVTEGVDRVRLNCSAFGNPSPSSLSWSPQGGQGGQLAFDPVTRDHHGLHTCTAVSNSGTFGVLSGNVTVNITVLRAIKGPRQFSVVPGVTSPVAMVTWTKEEEPGVSAYFLVELREGGGSWKNESRDVIKTGVPGNDVYIMLLEDLAPGTGYDVRARAYSSLGLSPYSTTVHFALSADDRNGSSGTTSPRPVSADSSPSLGTGGGVGVGLALGLLLASLAASLLYWLRLRKSSRQKDAGATQAGSSHYEGLDARTRHQPAPSDVTYQDIHLYENPQSQDRPEVRSAERSGPVT